MNKGSTLITEYATSDLKAVRDITWTGMDWGPTETRFKISCAPDRLYVVDGAWAPGLFTVDGLDGADPHRTDRSATVSGVGGLALNAAATDLYYWYQYGWSAGSLSTSVDRVQTSDLAMIDQSSASVPSFTRDPLDAPILLDETRGLVFVKNKVFDILNLAKVVYSLPSTFDTFDGAGENAYALDAERGWLATKNYVYDLARYDIVTPTIMPAADQLFFDASGGAVVPVRSGRRAQGADCQPLRAGPSRSDRRIIWFAHVTQAAHVVQSVATKDAVLALARFVPIHRPMFSKGTTWPPRVSARPRLPSRSVAPAITDRQESGSVAVGVDSGCERRQPHDGIPLGIRHRLRD